MCGITGILRTDGRPVGESDVRQMSLSLAHRGPDGEGLYVDGSLGLGHRRLAIIDLDGGRQPLSNEDETVWITFNGEIYNYRDLRQTLELTHHRFHTASDTEVIVHAYEQWGDRCVERLRGMFAFAIWDARKRRLLLARDRIGIKPLYYLIQPGLVAFASEMRAFHALKEFAPTLDLQAIDLYLHYQYIPAPYSIYREVRKLPPAHYLQVDRDGRIAGPTRYWDLHFQPDRALDESQWLERIDAALEETVSTHLVSDVPFGAFLSGGIDSSTVLAYMSRVLRDPVKAFTIGHQFDSYDERPWAREAAEVCGADYREEVVEPDALKLLPTLVQHYGEPFADSSAIPTFLVSRFARREVKMVLSGDGGDEMFAGYHAYLAILREYRRPETLYRRVRHRLANAARGCGLWPRLPSPADRKYDRTCVLEPALRRRLWKPDLGSLVDGTRSQFDERYRQSPRGELLSRLQYFDVMNYIPFDNLTKVDIASMYHGLEVRVPLLDHVFLETAAQLPSELKLHPENGPGNGRHSKLDWGQPMIGKYLLKKNAERFFSHEFVHRGKRGFEVPVRRWFAGPYREELRGRVLDQTGPLSDLFETACLTELLDRATESRPDAWKAWSLLVLAEWFQQQRATGGNRKAESWKPLAS